MKKVVLVMLIFIFSMVGFSNRYNNNNYGRQKTDKERKYDEIYEKYARDIRSIQGEIRDLDRKMYRDKANNSFNSFDLTKRKRLETKIYNKNVDFRNELKKKNLWEFL